MPVTVRQNFYRNIILMSIILFVFMCEFSYSQVKQTTPQNVQNTQTVDSLKSNLKDSVKTKQKSNRIDAEIKYTANDSIVFTGNGTGFLFGESDIKYKNINLKADFVKVKMDSSTIFARGTKDSLGVKKGEPEFSENDKTYKSRELTYNLKTQKGFIRQAVTQEGEGYIISDKTKKTQKEEFCMTNGKFTTCDNHDHPDFYLSMSRGKVKPGEYVVTSLAHLVVVDVPLPIIIPFGFFPFTSDYSSGILMPSYVDELTRGFGLTNGGYYFAINDYMDIEMRSEIYTKGTWALRGNSTYRKKYKFSGSLGVEYREDVTGEKGMTDYNKAKSFRVTWSHSQDQKANPNFNFSSSVNFSTSGFSRSNINYYSRPDLNSENTKYSSINFSKRFPNLPSLSLSGGMSVTQRTSDSTISMSLPNINVAYSRFYPFKRKNIVGKERWYEKISMSYSGALANSITTKENLILKSSLSRDWKNGMRHSIPVSATFNVLKYINISPSFNYTERWYLQSVNKSWDKENQREKIDTLSGFNRVYDFNMGVSASTKLYGFFIPIRTLFGDKVDRIRHVMTPSIGFGYTPDFGDSKWGYYDYYTRSVRSSTDPAVYTDTQMRYSHYDGSLYGSPGTGKSGSINFSLGNNVEMKVRNDRDTTGTVPFKIYSLIDNLSIGGNYNLAADSMRWSNFSVGLRLKLTKSYSLSLSTSFDPYMYALNSSGYPVRVNELRWNNGKFPRFQGTSTSYSYTLNNDTFKKLFEKKQTTKKTDTDTQVKNEDEAITEENTSQKPNDETSKDTFGYVKNTIPWSISINYSVSYVNSLAFNKPKMEYNMEFRHNLSLNGSLDLTKNWKFTANSSYDFEFKQFTYTSINISRSLHCWSMSGSIVPFGAYKSYSFHIGVNASMLADLKYDKQPQPSQNVITWY
jgi:lipopolysaccharide assembly outer membrane protein LptD (OstA)